MIDYLDALFRGQEERPFKLNIGVTGLLLKDRRLIDIDDHGIVVSGDHGTDQIEADALCIPWTGINIVAVNFDDA